MQRRLPLVMGMGVFMVASACERRGSATPDDDKGERADPGAAAGQPVKLTFDWPQVLVADVVYTNAKKEMDGEQKSGGFAYQVRGYRDQSHVHVFARDFSFIDVETHKPRFQTSSDAELQ